MSGGPIPAYMYVDSGFFSYRTGVYTHACDTWSNHVAWWTLLRVSSSGGDGHRLGTGLLACPEQLGIRVG